MSDTFVCSCCGKQKDKVVSVPSKLLGASFLLCQTCLDFGHEPRFAVILAARSPEPPDALKQIIIESRWCGAKIALGEVAKR